MGTPPYFAFYLRRSATEYYYVSGGNVLVSPTKRKLPEGPDGWREEGIRWERNMQYHGIFTSYSQSLNFINDGAKILRYVYLNFGIEAPLQLEVEVRNNSTWLYDPYFIGDIDLSTCALKAYGVSASAKDGGLNALFTANENVPYEVPIEDSDCITVLMDGINLEANLNYISFSASGIVLNNNVVTEPEDAYPLAFVTQEGAYTIGNAGNSTPGVPGYADNVILDVTAPNGFSSTITGNINLSYHNSGGSASGAKIRIKLYIFTDNTFTALANSGNTVIFEDATFLAPGQTRAINQNVTYDFLFSQGQQVVPIITVLFQDPTNPTTEIVVNVNEDSQWDIGAIFQLPSTITKAYRYHQVAEKMVKKLGNAYGAVSTWLSGPGNILWDNYPYRTAVTCGDALRGLTTTASGEPMTPAIRTTWRDLYLDCFGQWCMGLGIEGNNVRLERLPYFYDRNVKIADLGAVADLEVKTSIEDLYNLLQIGIENQDYDELNGRDEFNTTSSFLVERKRVKNTGEWVSPWRNDMYGIEYTRANLIGKKTTDSDSDNDTFLLSIGTPPAGDVPNVLARPQLFPGNFAEGILFPDTAFNIDQSPGRKYRRLLPLIRAITYKMDGQTVKFQTSDKNQSLRSNLGAGIVDEDADVPVTQSVDPLFLPVLFTFTCPVPTDLHIKMAINPRGYLSFTWKGNEYRGFVIKAGQTDAENQTFEFELLATPDNDLTKLIY